MRAARSCLVKYVEATQPPMPVTAAMRSVSGEEQSWPACSVLEKRFFVFAGLGGATFRVFLPPSIFLFLAEAQSVIKIMIIIIRIILVVGRVGECAVRVQLFSWQLDTIFCEHVRHTFFGSGNGV